jgi:hypothetical protein
MARIKTVDRIHRMDEITEERIKVAVLAERSRIISLGNVLWSEYSSDPQFGAAQQAAITTYMDDIMREE